MCAVSCWDNLDLKAVSHGGDYCIFAGKTVEMNLHEYQGKERSVALAYAYSKGIVAKTVDEAVAAAKNFTKIRHFHLGGEGPDPRWWPW